MRELEEKIREILENTLDHGGMGEIQYDRTVTKIIAAFTDHVKGVEVENPHPHYVTDITPMMQLTEVHNPMRDEFNRVVQATKRAILGE